MTKLSSINEVKSLPPGEAAMIDHTKGPFIFIEVSGHSSKAKDQVTRRVLYGSGVDEINSLLAFVRGAGIRVGKVSNLLHHAIPGKRLTFMISDALWTNFVLGHSAASLGVGSFYMRPDVIPSK